MKKLIIAFFAGCVIFISGCSDKAYVNMEPPIIESDSEFLKRCTADTPVPENPTIDKDGKKVYDGNSSIHTLEKWQLVYDDCAVKHDALIKLIQDLQRDRIVILKKKIG